MAELELIFNSEHHNTEASVLEKEAGELLARYKLEVKKQKIAELNEKLAELDDESDEYEVILREIRDLQKT